MFRYKVGDLFGMGINLRPEQVALLEQGTGTALVVRPLPDPMLMMDSDDSYLFARKPGSDRIEQVMMPAVLHYNTSSDLVTSLEDWYGEVWRLFPSLIGELDAGEVDRDDEAIIRLWDAWPLTPDQADRVLGALHTALDGSRWEQLRQWARLQAKGAATTEEAQEVIGELGVWVITDDDGSSTFATPYNPDDLTLSLGFDVEIEKIWQSVLRSSKRGWTALERAFSSEGWPAWETVLSTFSPWS